MGGTRTSCAVGSSPDDLSRSIRFSTTDPAETLAKVVGFLGAESLDAVGIAAFGPLDLERGRMAVTPKEGWSGIDVVSPIRDSLDAPIGLDTDVNGAALGEGRWGAGRGLRTFAYVTVGTGIGGGALVDGHPLHGLGHPEMGHISVRRHPEDDFRGICPLHGDCLEGLASGPAIQQRSGIPGQDLSGTDLKAAVEFESFYLSQLMRSLVYILAPQRVILGGGVVGTSRPARPGQRKADRGAFRLPGPPRARIGIRDPTGSGRDVRLGRGDDPGRGCDRATSSG